MSEPEKKNKIPVAKKPRWTLTEEVKQAARLSIIEYLSNPENDFIVRIKYSTDILKYKHGYSVYSIFSPEELTDIEQTALALRRAQCLSRTVKIDEKLFELAEAGDLNAIKLYYEKFEGLGSRIEHNVKGQIDHNHVHVSVEYIKPDEAEVVDVKQIDNDD